jgi:quinol monooxygenase YgiN
MTAFNAVRFKVKPGRDQEFLDAHAKVERNWPGMRHANMIKTGEQSYCIIGEWDDMDAMAAARPHMIATLDTFRHTLDGDTDPVSGPVVMELK